MKESNTFILQITIAITRHSSVTNSTTQNWLFQGLSSSLVNKYYSYICLFIVVNFIHACFIY